MNAPFRIRWWRTDLGEGEIRAVEAAIRNRHINQGSLVAELEQALASHLNVPFTVLTNSGSSALFLALLANGIRPGDEVIIPAHTFIATAHAVLLAGASVRLMDVLPDQPLMDPSLLDDAWTEQTRAVIPVHLNGAACDLPAIRQWAKKRNVIIIEDAAQAFCSRNEQGFLGTHSEAGAFSLSIAKLLTTAAGGFVTVQTESARDKLRRLRNHGMSACADNVFDEFGFDLKLTDIQAAMGLVQLSHLQKKIEAVKHVYAFYEHELRNLHYLRMLPSRLAEGELPLWGQVLCAEREKVIALLQEHGIEARPFTPCLSKSPHLHCPGRFPHSEYFSAYGLTLPSGPDQSEADLEYTVSVLRKIGAGIHADSLPKQRS